MENYNLRKKFDNAETEEEKAKLISLARDEALAVKRIHEMDIPIHIPRSEEERNYLFNKAEESARLIPMYGDLGTSKCGDVARVYEATGHYDKAAEYYLMHSPSIPEAKRLFVEKNIDRQRQEEIRERAIVKLEAAAQAGVEQSQGYIRDHSPQGEYRDFFTMSPLKKQKLELIENNTKFYQSVADVIKRLDFDEPLN